MKSKKALQSIFRRFTRSWTRPGLFWVVVLVFGGISSVSASPHEERPNVVFILADDLGWKDLSCYGSEFYQTPNIDALAERGMLFTEAYAANPLCSPTRASILTGRWPSRIGITMPACHKGEVILEQTLIENAPAAQKALVANCVTRLDTKWPSLGKCFQEAGYATGHIGKWHLGKKPYTPLEHGFDEDIPHTPHPSPMGNGWFPPWPTWPKEGKPGEHLEERMAEEAVAFIRRNAREPFFLQYWMFETHGPYDARKELIDKYEKLADPEANQRHPVYAAMVEHMDEAVGRVVGELERQDLMDNTIIVFTSDNGPVVKPKTRNMLKNYRKIPVGSAKPLRGDKGSIYEAGTRVPLIVVWPGATQPNSQNTEAIIQSIDFFPTLAELCGLETAEYGPFDGTSFAPALRGESLERDAIYCHVPHYGNEMDPVEVERSPATYVRRGNWKLIRFHCDNDDLSDRVELYDLATDIGETKDLSQERPEKVAALSALLDDWLKDSGAAVPIPNPGYSL